MRLLMGIVRDRHGTYYARKKVPPRLQEAVARVLNNGKARQVWLKRSLDTKVIDTANPHLHKAREGAHKAAAVANEAAAERHAATVLPIIRELRKAGAQTLREIAEALNARGVRMARGGQWHATTVSNVLARA